MSDFPHEKSNKMDQEFECCMQRRVPFNYYRFEPLWKGPALYPMERKLISKKLPGGKEDQA